MSDLLGPAIMAVRRAERPLFVGKVNRDLARGLTVSDFCRKVGVAQTTYHRWRKRHDPAQVDSDRRCRQLEVEVERLKRLVAELLLDKQMLQDVAKKKW
jgi:putative transposase